MRKFINSSLKVATTLAVGLSLQAQAQTLEWTTGQLGGGWYGMGAGLSNLVMDNSDLVFKVVPGGGKDNPSKIQAGISQVGMGLDFLSYAALQGTDPYTYEHSKIRTIGKGWSDNIFHFIGPKDYEGDLKTALEQDGLRIGVNKMGSSDELTFVRIMEHYGTSYDDIRDRGGKVINGNYSDLNTAFKDGQIDFIFNAQGVPGSSVIELANSRREIKLVGFPEEVIDFLNETYGYGKGEIADGVYSADVQSGAMKTPIMGTIMLVAEDLSDDTVYSLTKTLVENKDKFPSIHSSLSGFDPATAWQTTVPLHPGAEKFYKELGYMK